MDARPIGVFDSGTGGLTVLHECLVTMPHEDFVYLGDHARLPYGPRPLEEVRGFALEIGRYLERQDVKLVLVACNSATSAALPQLQEVLSVPVVGVIQPEAHAAVQASRSRKIGLLATEATVDAGRYAEFVAALDAGAQLVALPCPRLVPLIEGDDPFGAETTTAVREYAKPLKDAGVDTVILGCTHYPLIRPVFQRVFGRGVTLVFSTEEGVPRWLMGKGRGCMTAEYSLLPASTGERTQREASRGRQGGRTVEIQRLIGRALRSVTDFQALGERTVYLDCDVLQADGGTRCAAITGAYVAASRALDRFGLSKALTGGVAAVSVGVVDGASLLDLDYSEDSNADVDVNVVMTGDGRFVEVQSTAEKVPFDRARLDELLDLAVAGIEDLAVFQQEAVDV